MKNNGPGRVNKTFLLIMASASFLLHCRKPNHNNDRRNVALNDQWEFEREILPLHYLMATNHAVALYYANRPFFGGPPATEDEIREQRITYAQSAQAIAQSLLVSDRDMTVTPIGRSAEYTLDQVVPGTIGDAEIADHVNALGTLRVQAILNEIQRILPTL